MSAGPVNDLSQTIKKAQEEERLRIARELHDEFGQWLTAIQLDARMIAKLSEEENPQVQLCAESISNSADQIHKGIRRMMSSLRPPRLEKLGISESLKELVSQWEVHNPNTCCALSLTGELNGLDEVTEISVYRVAQEFLNNVAKHANASFVSLRLRENESGSVTLSAEDNGIGMDMSLPQEGMGIIGMRERVNSVSGRFHLDSKAGEGTRIKATFPINQLEA